MSDLRVRIGPSVDRAAFDAAFSSIAQSAKRAFEAVNKELGGASKAALAYAKEVAKAERAKADAQKETAKAARANADATKEAIRSQKLLASANNEVAKTERIKAQAADRAVRERVAGERQWARETERAAQQAVQATGRAYTNMKRQAREAASSAHPRFAMSLGHGTSLSMSGIWGAGGTAMRMGMGVAGDIAHAYGVNTDLGEAMSRNASLDTLVTQITNEAHEHGQAYADPEALKAQAFKIGNATGMGANSVAEGFQEFVGKTGDLKTASASMEELAKIAKGTGSSLKDVVGAAADVSNQLGDIPDKGRKVNEIMRVMAGESKLGAVPMRALASQMSKVVSQAQLMEGDVGKNMGLLGAIAQESRLRGGSASAQQAATSVQSLMNTFGKGARAHAFGALGIGLTGAGGKSRNVEDIIVESLQKTQKGNAQASNLAFGTLFADTRARNAVRGFESIFRSTASSTNGTEQEKLAAATEAVRKEFDRLQKAAMDQQEVDESFARAMKTGQSQAELWNNATQQAAGELQKKLLPAMVALTPAVVSAAGEFTQFVGWLTGNKGGGTKATGASLDADMDAVHKAVASGHVKKELIDKAMADVAAHGKASTDADNEARGMMEHKFGNRVVGGIKAVSSDWWESFRKGDVGGMLSSGARGTAEGVKRADADQIAKAEEGKRTGDEATRAQRELVNILNGTIKVHIESSDVQPGAANPSTDSLSPRPSGP